MSPQLSEIAIIQIMSDRLRESTMVETEEISDQRLIEQSRWLTEPILDYLDIPGLNAIRAINPLAGLVRHAHHYNIYHFMLDNKLGRQETLIGPDTLICYEKSASFGENPNHVYTFTLYLQEFDLTTYLSVRGHEKTVELKKRLLAIRERIRKDEIAAGRRNDPLDY